MNVYEVLSLHACLVCVCLSQAETTCLLAVSFGYLLPDIPSYAEHTIRRDASLKMELSKALRYFGAIQRVLSF